MLVAATRTKIEDSGVDKSGKIKAHLEGSIAARGAAYGAGLVSGGRLWRRLPPTNRRVEMEVEREPPNRVNPDDRFSVQPSQEPPGEVRTTLR